MTNDRGEDRFGADPEEWIVCTLFEGDYHFGLAALINSLVRNGFRGCISAGYRGPLPPWIEQLKVSGHDGEYEICPGIRVKFIPFDTPVHFTNLKPHFMRQLLHDQPRCKYIWYFDPDIVIRCSWSFFVQWVKYGVALCEDVNGVMPQNHPLRCRWIELASASGLKNPALLNSYYNAGFVGLPSACSGFLDLWQDVLRIAQSEGLDPQTFKTGDWNRTHPFYVGDQDSMNVAAMYGGYSLTTIGPEGMDFVPGGYTMSHAIGSPKPWRKNMVLSALRGVPPSASDKSFLAHLNYPIRPYSRFRLAGKLFGCSVGAFLGRFYRRF